MGLLCFSGEFETHLDSIRIFVKLNDLPKDLDPQHYYIVEITFNGILFYHRHALGPFVGSFMIIGHNSSKCCSISFRLFIFEIADGIRYRLNRVLPSVIM